MKKKSLILLVLLSFFGLAAKSQSIQNGIWKGRVSFNLNGIQLPTKEDEDCILPHEAQDIKTSIVKNLKKNGCSLMTWKVKNQNLEASLKCKNKDLDATGRLKGVFSKKSYNLKGEVQGTFKEMLPASATLELQGEWLKACPK